LLYSNRLLRRSCHDLIALSNRIYHPSWYIRVMSTSQRDSDRQRKVSQSFAKIVADSGIFEKDTFVPGFYDVHSFSTRVAIALKILPDDRGSFWYPARVPRGNVFHIFIPSYLNFRFLDWPRRFMIIVYPVRATIS